jgi:dihydroxyacetone kinase-like predicted kinase
MEVKKNDFMGIVGKKIVLTASDLYEATKTLIQSMVDDASSLVTVFCGEGSNDAIIERLKDFANETFRGVDFDFRQGDQPVYSFIIGVE